MELPNEFIILCAGKGQRMGELTRNCPKCMLTFRGKIMLKYIFETISNDFGTGRVILVISRKGEMIKKFFGKKYKGLSLEYVYQKREESKSALISAENLITKKHFFVLHGNVIIEDGFLKHLINDKVLASLAYSNYPVAPTHSLLNVEDGDVKNIEVYSGKKRKGKMTYMGISYISKDLIGFCQVSRVNSIMETLAILLPDNKIKGVEYTGEWFHFAYPKDLLK